MVLIYFRNLYEIEDGKLLCLAKAALSTLDRKPVIIKYTNKCLFTILLTFILMFSVDHVVLEH